MYRGCVCVTIQQRWNDVIFHHQKRSQLHTSSLAIAVISGEQLNSHTSSLAIAAVVRFSMMEVATDTSTALISAVLEVMLAKSGAACSGGSYESMEERCLYV